MSPNNGFNKSFLSPPSLISSVSISTKAKPKWLPSSSSTGKRRRCGSPSSEHYATPSRVLLPAPKRLVGRTRPVTTHRRKMQQRQQHHHHHSLVHHHYKPLTNVKPLTLDLYLDSQVYFNINEVFYLLTKLWMFTK